MMVNGSEKGDPGNAVEQPLRNTTSESAKTPVQPGNSEGNSVPLGTGRTRQQPMRRFQSRQTSLVVPKPSYLGKNRHEDDNLQHTGSAENFGEARHDLTCDENDSEEISLKDTTVLARSHSRAIIAWVFFIVAIIIYVGLRSIGQIN